MTQPTEWASAQHRRSVLWIVALATLAIIFDGYDLVVYGTILPTLMADPRAARAHLGRTGRGALGSYALIGVMVARWSPAHSATGSAAGR